MRPFEYARAATIDEALQQVSSVPGAGSPPTQPRPAAQAPNGTGARFLAGGTDLLTLMKADIVAPTLLVDIKRAGDVPRGIVRPNGAGGGVTLGALTTLSEIAADPSIEDEYAALAQAVGQAATPQLRNMATIGGNLLQRPRCWYYRNSLFTCWLKGGDACPARDGENQRHAIFGESPCVAAHPSDAASALIALDASVRLHGEAGERTMPVEQLFAEPTVDRRTETTIRPDELLLDIALPARGTGARSAYLKAMDREVWAFALVGVAVAVRVGGGVIDEARIVLSGVATTPWRAHAAEQTVAGQPPSDDLFVRAGAAALQGAQPLEHNAFKEPLARNLIAQALAAACK